MVNIPDLPFDNVHKFMAAVGIVLIVPSLFIEPVTIPSREILEVGVLAMIIGLGGWAFEAAYIPYLQSVEDKGSRSEIKRKVEPGFKKILMVRFLLPILFLVIVTMTFL